MASSVEPATIELLLLLARTVINDANEDLLFAQWLIDLAFRAHASMADQLCFDFLAEFADRPEPVESLTVAQAAALLNRSDASTRTLLRTRALRGRRHPRTGRWRVPRTELRRYLTAEVLRALRSAPLQRRAGMRRSRQ